MDSAERFEHSRSAIEDFAIRTLSVIDSDFGRLEYLSSLKDPATGQYVHAGLQRVYGEISVQCALEQCHEELFTRILETPLGDQETDLQRHFRAMGNNPTARQDWGRPGFYQSLCPAGMPNYLSELFRSNLNVLVSACSDLPVQ